MVPFMTLVGSRVSQFPGAFCAFGSAATKNSTSMAVMPLGFAKVTSTTGAVLETVRMPRPKRPGEFRGNRYCSVTNTGSVGMADSNENTTQGPPRFGRHLNG